MSQTISENVSMQNAFIKSAYQNAHSNGLIMLSMKCSIKTLSIFIKHFIDNMINILYILTLKHTVVSVSWGILRGMASSNRTFAMTIEHVQIIKNNIYKMKAWSFIDKSAEFQTNRLMDIKSAQHLVSFVSGRRGTLLRHPDVILQTQ